MEWNNYILQLAVGFVNKYSNADRGGVGRNIKKVRTLGFMLYIYFLHSSRSNRKRESKKEKKFGL